MLKRDKITKNIIKRYKEELRKVGINPGRVIQYGPYAKGSSNGDDSITLIIISDDLEGIDICKRLEVFALASAKISARIKSIGFTNEEFKELPMSIPVKMMRKGSRVA